MCELVEQKNRELTELCCHFQVQRLELFGSAARGGFDHDRSDLDFLVEFLPLAPGTHADAYFGLLAALKELFARDVDLVMTAAIKNPYLLKSINEDRMLLYAVGSEKAA
jgi:uncharacterized protein